MRIPPVLTNGRPPGASPPLRTTPHARGWRAFGIWLLALALGSAIGGAGQTPLAQAAPPADNSIGIWLWAEQVGAQRTLCVGDSVQIRVRILKRIEVAGRGPVLGYGIGRSVAGSVVGSGGVGTVSPANSTTGANSNPFGAAYFTFKAEKSGVVILDFRATVNRLEFLGIPIRGDTIKQQLLMQVEDCKYRLSLTSTWRVPGPAGLTVLARIQIAGMVEDGGGHYRGTARVQWIISAGQVGDCQATLPPDSQAEANGQVFGPDEFGVDVAYETATVTLNSICVNPEATLRDTLDVKLTPDPVTFIVPATGGHDTQDHLLRGPENTPGSVHYTVTRASGQ